MTTTIHEDGAAFVIFDPCNARIVGHPKRVMARKAFPCSGGCWPSHNIQPGERYQRTVYHDDEHGVFQTGHLCDWCAAGTHRPEMPVAATA